MRYTFRTLAELAEEANVVFVKEPNIVDAVTNHGDPFDAETKGPTSPHFRIVADILENLG